MSSSGSEASLLLQSYGPESLIEAQYGRRIAGPTSTLSEESCGIPIGPCHSTMTTMSEDSLPGESVRLERCRSYKNLMTIESLSLSLSLSAVAVWYTNVYHR